MPRCLVCGKSTGKNSKGELYHHNNPKTGKYCEGSGIKPYDQIKMSSLKNPDIVISSKRETQVLCLKREENGIILELSIFSRRDLLTIPDWMTNKVIEALQELNRQEEWFEKRRAFRWREFGRHSEESD